MKHRYLDNLPLPQAKARFFQHLRDCGFASKTETVSTVNACGRITAKAVYAAICAPHYNASAMDGVAVRAAATFGASEKTPVTLTPADYTVVDTGDPLPDGTDAVIMVEDLIDLPNGCCNILSAVRPWQNVRQVGEDICMGDMIAPCGTVLTPALCGALLAGGVTETEVLRRPTVGIIPTGDEIVAPTADPARGDIIEFNSTVFRGMLERWDAHVQVFPITKDNKTLLRAALEEALRQCDIVLISAGSSAGRDDYTADLIRALGTVLVHGIAIKPGKPAVLGEAQGKPVIGLPGYPVSAIVVMDEIVRETVDLYFGRAPKAPQTVDGVLAKQIVSSLKYTEYVRVSLGKIGEKVSVSPLPRGAGVISSFTKADGMLVVDQNCEGIAAGERVRVRLLCEPELIDKTLIVTGSHDPLIDEVRDLLQQTGAPFRVNSTHVGSMGAIYAIKSGLAHLGGIHLLDTETGVYNESYVKKHFPDGGAVIVRGVGRVQGLMVKKGNPCGIQSFADVARVRYVNRQRGAGTRILCDYLLSKNGISPNDVDGYENEEFTHTGVAALIAAGNADTGLGILSAAKIYDLDFIPVCTETYDFLVDVRYLEDPMVRAFFAALRSDACRARLEKMGGYLPEEETPC
ncbi:MAG: molybdopterin biosynthesis protein [Clostridia bacterium]|nr:molybdopterin biosynthesis protein [Clostridia bacterium]